MYSSGLHRSTTKEQVMKKKCYDLELAFKILKDQSAKVERERERERWIDNTK